MSEDIENAITSLRYAKQLLAETHAVSEVSLIDDAIDGLKRTADARWEAMKARAKYLCPDCGGPDSWHTRDCPTDTDCT